MTVESTRTFSTLRARFRALGDAGLFARLSDPSTLVEGALELSRLAHDADDLGSFISIIAAAGLGAPILRAGGSSALLANAIAGRAVLAVAITEEGAGSDVAAMTSTITRGPDGALRLTGSKWNITNAPVADAIIVFAVDATTDDRFLVAVVVEPSAAGVRVLPALDMIGCKGSPTGGLVFEDVVIAEDRVLGRPREGRALLDLGFVRERVLAPWPLLGKMERVLADCLDHVEQRSQFGQSIHAFQYVQEKIVSSFDAMLHARHLAERAIASVASGKPDAAIASLAKAAAADAAVHVFRSAIEIHASRGVQSSKRYGEYLGDALCAQIAGGTRETHKKIVFGELRLDRARARSGRASRLLRAARAGNHE